MGLLGLLAWPLFRLGVWSRKVTIAATPSAPDDTTDSRGRTVRMLTVLPMDAIRSIDRPLFAPAQRGEAEMEPDEPVIGLESNGDARAYPTFLLSRHEIVNDVVGGVPVAVTW